MAFTGTAADSIQRESTGSTTLLIANFAAMTSALWISGVPNAVGFWANGETSAVGVSTAMASSSATGSSAGVYFYLISNLGAQNTKLYVMSRN